MHDLEAAIRNDWCKINGCIVGLAVSVPVALRCGLSFYMGIMFVSASLGVALVFAFLIGHLLRNHRLRYAAIVIATATIAVGVGTVFLYRNLFLASGAAVATSFLVAVVWQRKVRPSHFENPGRCSGCDYDLTDSLAGICPECGAIATIRQLPGLE